MRVGSHPSLYCRLANFALVHDSFPPALTAEIFMQLKDLLYTDNAISGEAASIAMGLTALGAGAHAGLSDMLQYARETQHEKIIRGTPSPLLPPLNSPLSMAISPLGTSFVRPIPYHGLC